MKKTKKILSILLSCLMLMSMLSVGVFAAEGDQDSPINANDKWFGWGVDCFLMNTTLDAGDSDGVWYELTADAAGILQLENSYYDVDYQITVNVNGQEYLGYENGVYNMPIATLPVAIGDVISIHLIAQDTTLGGTVYMNAKFITGANEQTQTVKLKGANVKVWVANGATVYFQDDSLQAEYAAKGLELSGSAEEGITVISNNRKYTDTDGDGIVELVLGGSAGSAGAPPVKPAFAIQNKSGADAWFVLNVAETAHECVYDDDTDADCNTCGAIREVESSCDHLYIADCAPICTNCGEVRETTVDHDYQCSFEQAPTCNASGAYHYQCTACGDSYEEYPPATGEHVYDNDFDADCNVCGEIREVDSPLPNIDSSLIFGGTSVTEAKSGAGFKFDVNANGIVWDEQYNADYTNATVTIEGTEYKLLGMGAIANNQQLVGCDHEDVNDVRILDIPARKVFEDDNGAISFAVRIISIPEEQKDTVLYVRPYLIYEDADGNVIYAYGADQFASYNSILFG